MLSVCLGIAVDDNIHFVVVYDRLRKLGYSFDHCIATIFTHVAPALYTSTLVLVLGLGAMAFGKFSPNVDLGTGSSTVFIVDLFSNLLFLPAILLSFKDKPKAGTAVKQDDSEPVHLEEFKNAALNLTVFFLQICHSWTKPLSATLF